MYMQARNVIQESEIHTALVFLRKIVADEIGPFHQGRRKMFFWFNVNVIKILNWSCKVT